MLHAAFVYDFTLVLHRAIAFSHLLSQAAVTNEMWTDFLSHAKSPNNLTAGIIAGTHLIILIKYSEKKKRRLSCQQTKFLDITPRLHVGDIHWYEALEAFLSSQAHPYFTFVNKQTTKLANFRCARSKGKAAVFGQCDAYRGQSQII